MKEACIGGRQTLIADDEAPKVPQPGERPLHDPPPLIAPQLPPVLMGRAFVVPSRGDDRLDPPTGPPGAQRVAVIAPSRDQSFGVLPGAPRLAWPTDGNRVERRFEERNFCRGRRVQVCSQRRSPRHRP
jgi:hypothetical protein